MSELKKYTRLGSNSRQLAALLQAKAPKGEMLAYINPAEAALLRAHGGSGRPHADTGIPSFQPEFDTTGLDTGETIPYTEDQVSGLYAPGKTMGDMTTFMPSGEVISGDVPLGGFGATSSGPGYQFSAAPGVSGLGLQGRSFEGIQATPGALETPSFTAGGRPDLAPGTTALGTGAIDEARTPEKSLLPSMSKDTLMRLGLAGALGYLGSRQAKKAAEQGQAGKQEMMQMAAPYRTAGTEMQAKAQRGELMPVGQQSLQAAQAQIAQDIQRRGGVGAQQSATQMANLRQQLLQQQYDYGLKLSGIGDNIALGAIKTGLQADQYVNQLTNNFYSNMAYIASGMSPAVRAGGQ